MQEEPLTKEDLEWLLKRFEQSCTNLAEELTKKNMPPPPPPSDLSDTGVLPEEEIEALLDNMLMPTEELLSSPPLTTGDKILRKLRDIFDILWEDRRARQSQDIMCQHEVEILLEGFRLGQKSRDK